MIVRRYGFFVLFWLLALTPALAQTTYPIQVNVHLLPPHSLYLSDYYSTTRERIAVTLVNRDQLKPSVNVRLRMIISTPGGVRIQTNNNSNFQPLMVETGSPVRLTQDDLVPYFQPNNFITQGYLTGGKLPEGMVEFCFQAVEAYTGQVLSASTCTRAWITSQKPPLLSLPRNNESIAFREPLNVLFQWTPLHQGLAQVEYDFILKELWDNGMTPQAAFPYSPEIYRETTTSTSIIYGALQPALLPGKRYAWCVRAKAREGMDEVNLFQNDGYSEIRWFTLQDNCLPPEYVEATAERKRINLTWNTLPEYIGFTVSYRVKSITGETQNEWKELQTQEAQATLYGLQSGATYEYRIASMCMAGQPVFTPIMQIAIPATDSARLAQCGILPDVNLTNQEPIRELKTAEEFRAGDFPITITRISGTDGNFTGEGWTIIPWLNDAKVAVEFRNININTDHQMTYGYVEAKYDRTEGQIANLDDVFEGGYDQGIVKTGLTRTDTTFNFSIPGVESFALNNEGDLVITDATGEAHTVAVSDNEGQGNEGNKVLVFPMTVKDKDGNVYHVEKVTDPNDSTKEIAKATKLGSIGAPLADDSFDREQLNSDKAIVTFRKGNGTYAFDTWEDYYDLISLIEEKYEKLDNDYYAPWKFLPDGGSDEVEATIKVVDQNIDPTKVIFTTPLGTRYDATHVDGTYKLRITAGPEGDVQELYALYPRGEDKYYTLGKLGIATYKLQVHKLVLVSVEGTVIDPGIEQKLKDIYGPVGITWQVTRDQFAYNGNIRLMENSTGLSTYNDAMKALNDAYKTSRPYDQSTNYLFFLKATGAINNLNDRDLTGFMPRGAQFGYIFTSEVENADEPQVVAHELGHGRWKLYHPFDKHYGGFEEEAKDTENVMSYGDAANHLAKWQWDQMNDPALLVSVFESDERSMAISVDGKIFEPLAENGFLHFITPAGKIITLPVGVSKLTFSTYDKYFKTSNEQATNISAPIGSLISFQSDNVTYSSYGNEESLTFIGYKKEGSELYFEETSSRMLSPTKGIAVLATVENNAIVGYAGKFNVGNGSFDEKNRGSGDFVTGLFVANLGKDDLLKKVKDYFTENTGNPILITDTKYFVAEEFQVIDPVTNLKADDYLKSVLNAESNLGEVLAQFSLIYKNPEVISQFAACVDLNREQALSRIITEYKAKVAHVVQVGEFGNGNVSPTSVETLEKELELVVATSFNQTEDAARLKTAIFAAISADQAKAAIQQYYSTCAFRMLDIAARKKILEWLFKLDNDYWNVSERNIIYEVINLTPDDQIVKLLKAFGNEREFGNENYKWLYTLLNEGSSSQIAEVIGLLSPKVRENFSELGITPTTESYFLGDFTGYSTIQVPVATTYFYMGLREGQSGTVRDGYREYEIRMGEYLYNEAFEIEFVEAEGKIRFKQWYDIEEVTAAYAPQGTPRPKKTHEKVEFKLDPFESLTIVFVKNYPELGISANTPYVMPAISALLLSESVDDANFARNLRIASYPIIVLASIPTAGGSFAAAPVATFLARLTIVTALIDTEVQARRFSSVEEYNRNKEFYDAWEVFYQTVGLADGVYAISRIGMRSILKQWESIKAVTAAKSATVPFMSTVSTSLRTLNYVSNLAIKQLINGLKSQLDNATFTTLFNSADNSRILWANPNSIYLSTARIFLDETGESIYDLILDNSFYIKIDISDGRILLANTADKSVKAFGVAGDIAEFRRTILSQPLDQFNTSLKTYLESNATKLKILSGITSKELVIAGDLTFLSKDKVNTILGSFRPDLQTIFKELGSFKNNGLGETNGGINLLNRPDPYFDPATWWNSFNKPWLDNAITRGDNILLATKPTIAADLVDAAGNLKSTSFAREIDLLATRKVRPGNVSDIEWVNYRYWLGKEFAEEMSNLQMFNNIPAIKNYLGRLTGQGTSGIAQTKKFKQLFDQLGEGAILKIEAVINKVDEARIGNLVDDLGSLHLTFREGVLNNPTLVVAWNKLDDAGLSELRKDLAQLQKFDNIVKNNKLGLTADGLGDLLKSPRAKGLTWDNPGKLLDAVTRSSNADITRLTISHKKFPSPASGTESFVMKNAKQFQAEASGDAALSFDKGGVSFDDVAVDGKLIDRKYGHGSSIFDEDGGVINQVRANSIVDQARRQLAAVGGDGSKIRWEISTEAGANGIEQLFLDNSALVPGIENIEVVHVIQKTIIP